MFAIIIGLIVIALVVTLLLKGYYPQAILFMGGVVLLTCTAIFGWGDLLNAKQTTNFIGFDPENRGIYTQSDSSKKSSRNIWSLAVVSVDQRY